MANFDSGKPATDRGHESYADDAKAQRVLLVGSSGTTSMVTSNNEIKTLSSDYNLEISKGNILNHSVIHKFGQASDFDTGDNKVTIWDGANDSGLNAMIYTYSTGAHIDSLSSSNVTDTQSVEIQGLDTNKDLTIQTVTLSGTTLVPLITNLTRVFRIKNLGTTDFAGQIYCYEGPSQTAGVPTYSGSVRAIVDSNNNQTLMAIYTIPNGKTGYLNSFFGATSGAKKTTNYEFDLLARSDGGVFQLKHRTALVEDGTSHFQHFNTVPEKFSEKTDIEIKAKITASTIVGGSVNAGFEIVLVDN